MRKYGAWGTRGFYSSAANGSKAIFWARLMATVSQR
jgi:hypothetical protein